MDSLHDLGGMDGFGPIPIDSHPEVFASAWEARVFALTRAMVYTGAWTLDESRYTREQFPPSVYLGSSYYERWALSLEQNLLERGLATQDELSSGTASGAGSPLPRRLDLAAVTGAMPKARRHGSATDEPRPIFEIGQTVRAKNIHPKGHTRLPRYTRGHIGIVDAIRPCARFADATITESTAAPQQRVYTVVFSAAELWGDGYSPGDCVSIDAFESYLEAAPARREPARRGHP